MRLLLVIWMSLTLPPFPPPISHSAHIDRMAQRLVKNLSLTGKDRDEQLNDENSKDQTKGQGDHHEDGMGGPGVQGQELIDLHGDKGGWYDQEILKAVAQDVLEKLWRAFIFGHEPDTNQKFSNGPSRVSHGNRMKYRTITMM